MEDVSRRVEMIILTQGYSQTFSPTNWCWLVRLIDQYALTRYQSLRSCAPASPVLYALSFYAHLHPLLLLLSSVYMLVLSGRCTSQWEEKSNHSCYCRVSRSEKNHPIVIPTFISASIAFRIGGSKHSSSVLAAWNWLGNRTRSFCFHQYLGRSENIVLSEHPETTWIRHSFWHFYLSRAGTK